MVEEIIRRAMRLRAENMAKNDSKALEKLEETDDYNLEDIKEAKRLMRKRKMDNFGKNKKG